MARLCLANQAHENQINLMEADKKWSAGEAIAHPLFAFCFHLSIVSLNEYSLLSRLKCMAKDFEDMLFKRQPMTTAETFVFLQLRENEEKRKPKSRREVFLWVRFRLFLVHQLY